MVVSEHPARRRRSIVRTLLLTMLVIVLNASGNLLLAWGLRHWAGSLLAHPLDYVRALFHPPVAIGVAMLVLWLLTRMTLMSWADLSFVLPMTAVGYVLSAVLGVTFLGEHVSWAGWLGTLLIFSGAALVATTSAHSARHSA